VSSALLHSGVRVAASPFHLELGVKTKQPMDGIRTVDTAAVQSIGPLGSFFGVKNNLNTTENLQALLAGHARNWYNIL
jgi:hypothetical protein